MKEPFESISRQPCANPEPPALPANAPQFARRIFRTCHEHHTKGRGHNIKAAVGKIEFLGISALHSSFCSNGKVLLRLSITKTVFVGRLLDLTAGAQIEEEEAEFEIADIDPNERDLLDLGAVFVWLIAYRTMRFGRREKISTLIFRCLPMWRPEEIAAADEKARELTNALRWD